MGSAGEIRAGRAFVEMVIEDESIQTSLATVKAKLITFGTAVDATAGRSFTRMQATAVASTTASGASIGILTASMRLLQSVVYAVGNAFRVVFTTISGSVLKAVAGIGALALIIGKFAGGSKFSGFLNSFLSKSQTTEAIGRWTKLFGTLTGSSALRDFGKRITTLGMGASIVKGLQGGIGSGIAATFGVGLRAAKSAVASGVVGLFGAPFRAVGAMFRGTTSVIGLGRGAGAGASGGASLSPAAASANLLSTALGKSSRNALSLGSALGVLRSAGSAIAGLAVRFGGLATAISGPALLAARSFAATAKGIIDEAKESGKSIDSLIAKKFGDGGIVSKSDIRAGAELSDVFKQLKQATAAAWAQIGAAALPVLKSMTQSSIRMMEVIGQFLSQNRETITTVVQVAVKVAGAAAAIMALYGAFTAAIPIVTMLISPLGLVAAGVAGIAYAFPALRAEAMSALEFLFGGFAEFGTIVSQTMEGVMNAMSGGSIEAAARVLWAGVNLAWLVGTEKLREVYTNMVTNISAIGIDIFAGLQSAWVSAAQFFADVFQIAFDSVGAAWRTIQSGMVNAWVGTQNKIAKGFATIIAKLTGQNVNDVLETLNEMQKKDEKDRLAGQNKAKDDAELGSANAMVSRDDAAKKRLKEIEEERRASQQANTEIGEGKIDAAKAGLQAARDEFAAANDAAAKLAGSKRKKPKVDEIEGLKGTATLSSFSAAGVGRTNIGGFGDMKKPLESIEESAAKTAENTDPKNGLKWA